MMLPIKLVMLLLVSGLVLSVVPIQTVTACGSNFKLTVSPTSETIQRGSNFLFTISPTGPKCLTGIHVLLGVSVSPSVTNGPTFRTTGSDIPINVATPLLTGSTTLSTPMGTYTFTVTAEGIQFPIVGELRSASVTLMVT